jgi:hypothetical protein
MLQQLTAKNIFYRKPLDTADKDDRLRAMQEELTWDMFGGVITVNGHRYQVVDECTRA